jgi:hypothetical protein
LSEFDFPKFSFKAQSQSMNRRTALKYFGITGAAAMFLPGCLSDPKKVSVSLENLKITPDDEDLLADIAATLIPATDKPGAKEVNAHLFTFVMVDDCLPPEKKDLFIRGLREFNEGAPVPGKKTFLKASAEEKLETLKNLEKDSASGETPVQAFYKTAKRYIIQGYTTSQYFMTQVKVHKLVPGPVYNGCVPLPQELHS